MSYVNPIWLEGQRRRWQRHDAHRFIRHDAHRFFTPLGNERRRAAQAEEERKAQQVDAAEQAAFGQELLQVRRDLAALKFELALRRIAHKYSEDQPRVPAGSSDGGQWTSGGGGGVPADDDQQLGQDQELSPLRTSGDQAPRSDLPQLEALASNPLIRVRIDEAWNASNPTGRAPQEHGFWISRNEVTGEVFTRPFANPGSMASITPGPPPSDAIAFFHTHPNRLDPRFPPGPSPADENFATRRALPGLIQSHNGMYYFGPSLRPVNLR